MCMMRGLLEKGVQYYVPVFFHIHVAPCEWWRTKACVLEEGTLATAADAKLNSQVQCVGKYENALVF